MSRNPNPNIDYMTKDYEAFRNLMLNELDSRMPEYTDRSQTDAGIVIMELLAQGLDILSFYQDIIANETLLPTAEQRSSVLKWCEILGYTPKFATPAYIEQVFVLTNTLDSPFTIPGGTVVKTESELSDESIYFETEKDLVIPAGKLGDEKGSDGKYLYSVTAVQGVSVTDELLGSSNGTKGQKFTLKYNPVIFDSVKIYINEGFGFEPWTRVDSFVDSSPISRHFKVSMNDRDEATITFGDGVFGKIPRIYTNGIFTDYRIGGGINGNVGANKVTVLDSNIAQVKETFNPESPFIMGIDKESIESMKVNAPTSHRVIWGALTEQDFAEVAKINFPEIKFAQSIQNAEDIFSIDLYLLMQDGKPVKEEVKAEIEGLFDKEKGGRELAGLNVVTVKDATYKDLSFIASMIIKDSYSKSTIEKNIEDFLKYYFATGNYDFGVELSLTELANQIMNSERGIKSFKFTSPEGDIIVPKNGEILRFNSCVFDSSGGVD